MRNRKLIQLLMYLILTLFVTFCYIDWNGAIIITLILIFGYVLIGVFELIQFFQRKKELLKLGCIELFRSEFLGVLVSIALPIILYLVISKLDFLNFESNDFTRFFLLESKMNIPFYIVIGTFIANLLINDRRVFYATDKGLVTRGNYFESYFWNDFLGYKIIKEQSLIRFKKKNGKFLFITYDESLQGKEELIIESLSKNLTEDVKNINH
ncbi:conserved membrane protein of unknown function [Tenacibaculum sp. 190130A14a]|uniref:PH (Pleckstrin Homology) domain-containing protein n=1 Tax=Tenacibaculum polynesiense TaxID=3137857 RepID=A0ABM9PDN0_9FLAO